MEKINPNILASRKIATVMAILDSRNVARDLKRLIRKEMWSFFDQISEGKELKEITDGKVVQNMD